MGTLGVLAAHSRERERGRGIIYQKLEVDLSTHAKICADTLTLIGSIPLLADGIVVQSGEGDAIPIKNLTIILDPVF